MGTACSKEDCRCTTDREFARETDGVRLFKELEPGVFFEIDPDDL